MLARIRGPKGEFRRSSGAEPSLDAESGQMNDWPCTSAGAQTTPMTRRPRSVADQDPVDAFSLFGDRMAIEPPPAARIGKMTTDVTATLGVDYGCGSSRCQQSTETVADLLDSRIPSEYRDRHGRADQAIADMKIGPPKKGIQLRTARPTEPAWSVTAIGGDCCGLWDRFGERSLLQKPRCRLPADTPVTRCYEVGPDGFWLLSMHR